MTSKVSLLVFVALIALVSSAQLKPKVHSKSGLKGANQLNPVNTSVTYNESNLVNSSQFGK